MATPPPPSELPQWWQDLLAAEEKHAQDADATASTDSVPVLFMVSWGSVSAMALGSGALLGYRSFEGTAAFEALDKLDKPTAASEAQASRMAMRAFGWGTALAFGSAAACVLFARTVLGLRTATDVHTAAHATLDPLDRWLHRRGKWLESLPQGANSALDGLVESVATRWQQSAVGREFRRRVERGGGDT